MPSCLSCVLDLFSFLIRFHLSVYYPSPHNPPVCFASFIIFIILIFYCYLYIAVHVAQAVVSLLFKLFFLIEHFLPHMQVFFIKYPHSS